MNMVPQEFAFGGVYMPPLLIAALAGLIATTITIRVFNQLRLSKYFYYPPLVSLSLMVIYTILIGTYIIKV